MEFAGDPPRTALLELPTECPLREDQNTTALGLEMFEPCLIDP
jgi:hypothetical protein